MEASDEALWQRAAAGEAACFGLLFERHERSVRSYCHQRAGSLDAADDLVSIVFLEAWRRRKDVQLQGESLLPWFLAVAGRVMKHRRRTQFRHAAAMRRLNQDMVVPDHADHIAAKIDDGHLLDRINVELTNLNADERAVFDLCVRQNRAYADAAAVLGIPVGTVRSRLSRARAKLHRAIAMPPSSSRATTQVAATTTKEL